MSFGLHRGKMQKNIPMGIDFLKFMVILYNKPTYLCGVDG